MGKGEKVIGDLGDLDELKSVGVWAFVGYFCIAFAFAFALQ